jgi:hypothetical protein
VVQSTWQTGLATNMRFFLVMKYFDWDGRPSHSRGAVQSGQRLLGPIRDRKSL